MIKVNYWMNALDYGGTSKTAYLFAKYLDKSKYEVEVFSYSDADLVRMPQFMEFCKVTLIDRKNPNWSLLNDCSLLHSFRAGHPEKPEAGVQINVPHFVQTNVFGFYNNNPFIECDIFMSKWLMERTVGCNPVAKRFTYIYNPVESPATSDKFDLGLCDSTIVLGRNGRPDNGVYDNISVLAAAKLLEKQYKIHFLCMAPPPAMIADLQKYQVPYTSIEPSIDPVVLSKFYNSISVYVEARYEGHTCGSVLQEALIHGKPCVSYIAEPKYPGMAVFQAQTDIIQHGKTGFISKYDIEDFTKHIELATDWNGFCLEAVRDASERFHILQGIKKLERIYEDVSQT